MLIVAYDAVRVLGAVAAIGIVGATPAAVLRPGMTWHHRARFLALALFGVVIVGATLDALGNPPTPGQLWRTPAITVAAVLALVGTAAFLDQTRTDARGEGGRHAA